MGPIASRALSCFPAGASWQSQGIGHANVARGLGFGVYGLGTPTLRSRSETLSLHRLSLHISNSGPLTPPKHANPSVSPEILKLSRPLKP